MKQRFSAAGSIPLWMASSLEGLDKGGFEDIYLNSENSVKAAREGRPFSVLITDRSPGQITLELVGPSEDDFNHYKYHVAKSLKRRMEEKDYDLKASDEVSARLKEQEEALRAKLEEEKKNQPAEAESSSSEESQTSGAFEAPDFSELQEGVTAPLPIVEILATEEAITRETLARQKLEEAARRQEEAQAETESPVEETRTTETETAEITPNDDQNTVVVVDELTQLGSAGSTDETKEEKTDEKSETEETKKDESTSAKPEESIIDNLLGDDRTYEDLTPIENPTTAGELYNNMLIENTPAGDEKQPEAILPKRPWYKQDWFVLLLLILCPPAGLILVWHFKLFTDKVRKIATIFFAIYTVLWVWMITLIFMPAPTTSTSGTVTVKATEVVEPSKTDQIAAYWNEAAVQAYTGQMPGLIKSYQDLVNNQGYENAGDQILAVLQNIQNLDDDVLKISTLAADNAASPIQEAVNLAAVTFNEGILNVRTALNNSDTDALTAAREQIVSAITLYYNIQSAYDTAMAS